MNNNILLTTLLFQFLFLFSLIASSQNVTQIRFEGIKKTKESSLLRIIDCEVGERIDSTMLKHDVDKISRLPGIAAALFFVDRIKDGYHILFKLEENFSVIPSVNIWNADSILAFQIGAYDVNFLGRNLTIGGFYQNNGLSTYGMNLSAPYLIKGRFGIELNMLRWASYEPLYFEDARLIYEFNFNSNEALALYRLNARNSFKAGVSFFNEIYKRKEDIPFQMDSVFPDEVDLNKMLYKFVYEFNNVNYFYYLLNGFKSKFNFQRVTTEGDEMKPFLMAWNDFSWYKRSGVEGNIAVRFRLGIATNSESPFAPFALDNQQNIRGIGTLTKRGTGTAVLNTEYRHTILAKKWFRIQGNAFVDMGVIRLPGISNDAVFENESFDAHVGIGLRFIHKTIFNAILRVDYGIGITKDNTNGFVIGVGQYF